MPKMSVGDLRALLTAERTDALSAMSSSRLSEERAKAQRYYHGDMSDDMPSPEGRSGAVSTDVSDTVEGMMPQLMDIFAGSDEVVKFDPVGPEDVQAAEQETDYIGHVFMQQNQGFIVLYSMIKDALLSKTGIVKCWWGKGEDIDRETYLDMDEASYTMLVADPEVEVVEHTVRNTGSGSDVGGGARPDIAASTGEQLGSVGTHDVTVETKRKWERACVEAVAPEEFGIARNARSIKDCGYCFHEVLKRRGELIADGYDPDQINNLPAYTGLTNTETQARDTIEERTGSSSGGGQNTTNQLVRITEHYVRMDYEGDGKPGLYRVVTGGESEGEILRKDGEEVIVREDMMPFAVITPIVITHRFFGRSIADLVMDIQRIKTALTRGMLDNLYAHNNPRPVVNEVGAGESTLDDVQIVRHGQPIRTKQPGAIEWTTVPDITGSIFPALQYLDATREWRTGVSRQGQGVDPNALQNQVATIANQMEEASQGKIKLIARIFADGIKDLFMLLHGVIRKNCSKPQVVRLRNQWVPIDPRDWKKRNDMTINVGLGTGNKAQQMAGLQLLIGAQEKSMPLGMLTAKRAYNSASRLCHILGYQNPDEFFRNPSSPPEQDDQPIQPPQDPKVAQAQQKLELDKQTAQADAQLGQQEAEATFALKQREFEAETMQKIEQLRIESQLKIEQMNRETALALREMQAEHALKLVEIRENARVKETVGHAQANAKLNGGVRFGGDVG